LQVQNYAITNLVYIFIDVGYWAFIVVGLFGLSGMDLSFIILVTLPNSCFKWIAKSACGKGILAPNGELAFPSKRE